MSDMQKAKNQENGSPSIAIIGMAGRFPGANSIDSFWENLRDGVEGLRPLQDDELEASPEPGESSYANGRYVKAAGVIEGADSFDAAFFSVYPKEAQIMDPQHRLFMECSWHAMEDAGYDPARIEGSVGVYAGCYWGTYLLACLKESPGYFEDLGPLQTEIGNDKDYLATRISFKFNLRGPAMTLQTACSTSLVAVSQACQALHQRQCDMALAGGVHLRLPQKRGYWHQEGSIFSPDGHCRAFDAKAQGTVFANGVAVVLLKRLEDALADRDSIYAVIKGWGLNNDGSAKDSYTAPSVEGQAGAIRMAHQLAGFPPETITYVEAHGTATQLGDPIEVAGLSKAFRQGTDAKQFCAIGSVKTNVGHLDVAAGATALIKTALSLKHRQIPPSLHYESPNARIDFPNSPFYVNAQLSEWKTNGIPRRAGVSSFGIGGTNAHVVLEEAPVCETSVESRPYQLVLLSAKTRTALDAMTENLANYGRCRPTANLAGVCFTTHVGRQAFTHRRFLVSPSLDDATRTLEAVDPQRVVTYQKPRRDASIAFMFPGQGAQYVGMGAGLYRTESVFRDQVDRCADLLLPHLEFDIRRILYPADDQIDEAKERINQTEVTQPAIFVLSYAMSHLWMSWGIRPQSMIGHSIGEFVAACLAGVFSLEEALLLVATRGRLMQGLPSGSMVAVWLPESEMQPLLRGDLAIAALNGPDMCVVAGSSDSVRELESHLEKDEIEYRALRTSHAFHSSMMDPIVQPFAERVAELTLNPPEVPIVSTATGTWMTPEQATDPAYWARHLRQTVRFSDGVSVLLQDPSRILLEVGPGQTLSSLAKQHPDRSDDQEILPSLPHPKPETSDLECVLASLGRLWLHGAAIDWSEFWKDDPQQRIHLPGYPFDRKRHWIEPTPAGPHVDGAPGVERATSSGPTPGEAFDGLHPATTARVTARTTESTADSTIKSHRLQDDVVKRITKQQLQIMEQQLHLWRRSQGAGS